MKTDLKAKIRGLAIIIALGLCACGTKKDEESTTTKSSVQESASTAESNESAEQAESAETANSTNPTESTQASDMTDSSEASESSEASDSSQAADPTEAAPENTVDPAKLGFYTDYGTDSEKLWVDGTRILSAEYYLHRGGRKDTPVVKVNFDEEGTKIVKELTTLLYESKEHLYMVYDGKVLWDPDIQMVIEDGCVNIKGFDSKKAAEEMAEALNNQ